MVPIKIQCACGQPYSFEVEPVDGAMPSPVACPACGADGTAAANACIAAAAPPAPPPPTRVAPTMSMQRPAHAPPPVRAPAPAAAAAPVVVPRAGEARPGDGPVEGDYNLGLGVVGAILGAVVGSALLFAFFVWAKFSFPFMGVITGVFTGVGGRLFARAGDVTLGYICGGIAVVVVLISNLLMFGVAGLFLGLVSVVVSGLVAWRISSG